ncbi:MAG: hypothetical protein ACJZ69_02765 [Pelagibacteraceae bacterium]
MKYRILLIFFLFGCADISSNKNKSSYFSKGFAYIYNVDDFDKKITQKKFKNEELLIGHNKIKPGTLLKIINPENKKEITLKVKKKTKYPEFYNVLITKSVSLYLELDEKIPFVEVQEIKKNKSFIADRAKTFKEEKKVLVKAPIDNVKILDISNNESIPNPKIKKFLIIVGEFYSKESAIMLKERLFTEMTNFNQKDVSIKKKNTHSYQLLLGPYSTINSLKNSYIVLKNFGFEDLNIKIYE